MLPKITPRLLRAALAAAAAALTVAAAPAQAHAGLLSKLTGVVQGATSACEDVPTAQVFAPWLDLAQYKPAPGGDFEPGSPAWKLSGGAKVVAGNAPQRVGDASDGYALELPPGASATSPTSCAGLAEPTFRMFASGPITGLVLAQSVAAGIPVPAGVITGGPWSPTLPLLTGGGLLSRTFSVRVTNIGVGTMRVDDVYIDPYRRG